MVMMKWKLILLIGVTFNSLSFISAGSHSCTKIPGTIWNVSDQWCEQNCAGGAHPACNSGSGIFQQCSCENVSDSSSSTTSTSTTSTTTTTSSGCKDKFWCKLKPQWACWFHHNKLFCPNKCGTC